MVRTVCDVPGSGFIGTRGNEAVKNHEGTEFVEDAGPVLVAHALLRAVFALLRTRFYPASKSVHTSVNPARTSACAT